jgi:putative transposase
VDEFIRECLALEVEWSMKGVDVMDVLAGMMLRGVSKHIRSDNGPEFIARGLLNAAASGTAPIAA